MDDREKTAFKAYATLPAHRRKVERSIEIIREALSIGPAYVAWSGGKDSSVLLRLCQTVMPDIPAYFLAHSEQDLISNFSEVIRNYCDRFSTNYHEIRLSREVERIYSPTRIKDAMQDLAINYPVAFVGVRAEESANRRRSIANYGLIHQYKSGGFRAYPLACWGWQDIWAFTIKNDLPYLEAYDKTPKNGPRNRTSLHFGRSANSSLSAERWEDFKLQCPEFVQYIKENYDAKWL